MSGKMYWLIVFVLCFSAGPGSAQPLGFEGEVVDSQVVGILGGLDLADLEPGLEITRFENWPLVDNRREPRRSYNFTLIEWRAPRTEARANTRLMISLGRFSTPEELAGAWRAVNYARSVGGQQLEIGDAARGLYPDTVSFVKNGFVGSIGVNTYYYEDGDLGERLFEQVKDRLFAAIEAQGTPPTPGLDLSFHVLSASDPLMVDVDTGSSPFQHSIGHSVISAVEPHLVSSQGHELLTEENRTVTVSGLSPGDYRLGIDIIDELNRNEEFIYEFTVPDPSSPPDDPTSGSLPASKDATVYERGPHRNEGANPRLLLEYGPGLTRSWSSGFLELVHAFRTRPLATTGYLAQAAFSHLASSASSSASSTGSADAPAAAAAEGDTGPSLMSVLLIPEGHPEGPNPELSLRSPHSPQRAALGLALERVGEGIAGAVAGPHPVLTSLGALTYRAALEAV